MAKVAAKQPPTAESTLAEAVDTLNTASALLEAIAGLADGIEGNSSDARDASFRAQGIIALAEKATAMVERFLISKLRRSARAAERGAA